MHDHPAGARAFNRAFAGVRVADRVKNHIKTRRLGFRGERIKNAVRGVAACDFGRIQTGRAGERARRGVAAQLVGLAEMHFARAFVQKHERAQQADRAAADDQRARFADRARQGLFGEANRVQRGRAGLAQRGVLGAHAVGKRH